MNDLEILATDLDAFDRHLSRRRFLKYAAMIAVIPSLELDLGDRTFLRKIAETVITPAALRQTGIDVVVNIEHLISRGSAEHRAKVFRLLAWARRVSFLYGGEKIAVRARTSRFTLIQKMSKALSSLCLVAFWGDERAMVLISVPEVNR